MINEKLARFTVEGVGSCNWDGESWSLGWGSPNLLELLEVLSADLPELPGDAYGVGELEFRLRGIKPRGMFEDLTPPEGDSSPYPIIF